LKGAIKYSSTIVVLILVYLGQAYCQFRVFPYLQYPASDAMTIIWLSEKDTIGYLTYHIKGSHDSILIESSPVLAETLDYSLWEDTTCFWGNAPGLPYKHRIRLDNLIPSSIYQYTVKQGSQVFISTFRTAPDKSTAIRFIVYSDSETEPESTGKYAEWDDPLTAGYRAYIIDQSTGYRNNLSVIKSRSPDLIIIAGDLVESGGEQRDWDEFWKHNTSPFADESLAGRIPIMGIPGNHEYFEGPYLDQYNQPGSERAIKRFLTYFENPPNGALNREQEGRYYALKYGPVTFIVLDLCNNGENGTSDDTNFYLLGEKDPEGGNAPDFGPGSDQYIWLEKRLQEARSNSIFTFVFFHHSPYSSGPHGYAAGNCDTCDNQSGTPVRMLTPLFMSYGVDAVISGHDEIWERSEITGMKMLSDSSFEIHTLHFYDVGIGGDGLRQPYKDLINPYQKFVVHDDAPETWANNVLISGGKHYGHLEVNIYPGQQNSWHALLSPVHVFPIFDESNLSYTGFERRLYDDEIMLTKILDEPILSQSQFSENTYIVNYPNPFYNLSVVKFHVTESANVRFSIYNLRGQKVKSYDDGRSYAGLHQFTWDGTGHTGDRLSPGVYILKVETSSGQRISKKMMLLE